MDQPADFHIDEGERAGTAVLTGDWTAVDMGLAHERLGNAIGEGQAAAIDLTKIGRCDTSGAYGVLKAAEQKEKSVETDFRLPDRWSRRLFTALCRRHGLAPYRYPRQRYSTVVLRAPASFINNVLWPEFLEIKSALDEYLDEATERIIREEVFRVSEEAEERA